LGCDDKTFIKKVVLKEESHSSRARKICPIIKRIEKCSIFVHSITKEKFAFS